MVANLKSQILGLDFGQQPAFFAPEAYGLKSGPFQARI
jgi:hypothetical protein